LNLIKLSALKDEVMVYDDTIHQLKGITEHSVQTLGSAKLEIKIGTETHPSEFHVAHENFPVPNEGILGKSYIIGNKAIINYQTKELIITYTSKVTLHPRTETIITLPAPNIAENSNILNNTHNITEDVFSGNCVVFTKIPNSTNSACNIIELSSVI